MNQNETWTCAFIAEKCLPLAWTQRWHGGNQLIDAPCYRMTVNIILGMFEGNIKSPNDKFWFGVNFKDLATWLLLLLYPQHEKQLKAGQQ